MEEKKNRITEWIFGHLKRILVIAAAAAVIVILFLVNALWSHTSYETVSSYEHSRESNDNYVKFDGMIIQYGSDGITCLKQDGSSLWSKSYEMEQPQLVKTDHYLAVADQGGSRVYLFDTDGFLNLIETPYPVLQLSLADNGSVAAVLEESDACRIVLYDADGNTVADGQAHLDDNGYPAAAVLSADGTVMAVSYLTVSGGNVSSTLMFYDFTGTQSGTAQASVSVSYEGEAIVRLAVIGGKFAAFGDAAVRIFSGGSTPVLYKEIAADTQISSIVIGEDRFGIVYEADDEETAEYRSEEAADASGDALSSSDPVYVLDLYGSGGSRMSHTVFAGDYQDITFMQNGSAVILGTDSCVMISGMGVIRFSCTFDESICAVFSNGFSGYTFVFSDRIERVRLT